MKIRLAVLVVTALITLTGCGGGSSGLDKDNSSITKVSHGYYIDSAVAGVDYNCKNLKGITNNEGKFKFHKGDICVFSIGGIKLRELNTSTVDDGESVYEDNIAVARILQTLDKDGNPDSDGIKISKSSAKCLNKRFKKNHRINSVNDLDIEQLYNCLKKDSSYKGKAVTEQEAKEHIKKTRAKKEKDKTPPVITLNGANSMEIIQGTAYTEAGATAIDNKDGKVEVTITGSVNINTVGTYIITYTAKDKAGNIATKTRTVKVILAPDTTPPTITLNGASYIEITKGTAYIEAGATALDDRDGNITVVINGNININSVGTYTITYTATDRAGNIATKTRTVKVVFPPDTTAPIISLNGANPLILEAGDIYTELGATATDDRDGNVTVTISGSVDNKSVGDYSITYKAKDSAGNEATATRVVKVQDTTAPTITLKGDANITIHLNDNYTEQGVNTSDNANGEIKVTISGTVDITKVGEYTLTYTATDNSGNQAMVTRIVNVISDEANSTIELNSTQEYKQKLSFEQNGKYILENVPKGMAIFPNGTLVWTPTNDQAGDYTVTINVTNNGSVVESKNIDFHVNNINNNYDGIFIDLSGSKGGIGTPTDPYGTFKEACSNLNGKHNIYIRGGVYRNPGYHNDYSKSGRYPAISEECQGTKSYPIIIRPWGNEYVKLKTDALYGIRIKQGAKHITVQNMEIEGESQNITLDDALNYWWWDSNDTMRSMGIFSNGDDIIIKDNVVHDMPGSGIGASSSAYANIRRNIVYNCDWWTIAGSKGIGITSAKGSDANGEYKNQIVGNLIFNVEQRLFSHVWNKEFATLRIDEGEALLIQEGKQNAGTTSSSYNGKYLIKDNLLIYNGKAVSINLAKDVNLTNNSYYNNGGATKQSGFRISHTNHLSIEKNAVESNIPNTIIYSRDHFSDDVNITDNYAKGVITKNGTSIAGIESVDTLFKDPENLDFSIVSTLPQDIGASSSALSDIKNKLELYNIKVERKHMEVDKVSQTKYIVEHAPGKVDCSHYNDAKDPYVLITDINSSHPIVKDVGASKFKLYIEYKYGECVSTN